MDRRDLFISHSSADKETAAALAADFEKRGITCWIAPRDIPFGGTYQAEIVKAIERCGAMLLLFSDSANKSEHILREVELAAHEKKPIYPLRIDSAHPTGGLKYMLANRHWVEHKALGNRLGEVIAQMVAAQHAAETGSGEAAPSVAVPPPEQKSAGSRLILMGAAAAVVCAAVGTATFLYLREPAKLSPQIAQAPPAPPSPAARTEPKKEPPPPAPPVAAAAPTTAPVTQPPPTSPPATAPTGRPAETPPSAGAAGTPASPPAIVPAPPTNPIPQPPSQASPAQPIPPPPVPALPVPEQAAPGGKAAENLHPEIVARAPTDPSALGAGVHLFRECEGCPVMAVVPAGRYRIGSPPGERGRSSDEGPQQDVVIRQPFAVGRTEVSFDEWFACLAEGGCNAHAPSDHGFGRGKKPVIFVSWKDAQAYVAWLSRKTGATYRLLSEAEWEYAARGCTSPSCPATVFWFGDRIDPEQANYDWNISYQGSPKILPLRRTVEIDRSQSNPFGLLHMHGNVREWVQDCWNSTLAGVPPDASPRLTGDCTSRVVRGGSWKDDPKDLRSAKRHWEEQGWRDQYTGFRVARSLVQQAETRGPKQCSGSNPACRQD
jgi:formylglycine-generating enzyme required for sulfatase activity